MVQKKKYSTSCIGLKSGYCLYCINYLLLCIKTRKFAKCIVNIALMFWL